MFTAHLSTLLGVNDSRESTRGQLVEGTVEVQVVTSMERSEI